MRKLNLLFLGGTTFCAGLLFAQTLPPDHPSRPRGGIGFVDRSRSDIATRTFSLQGKTYRSIITWEQAASGRAWDPSTPLPISLDQAEEIARKELAKLVSDEVRWQFAELSIGRFRAPSDNGENWYFALTMKPALAIGEVNSDFFTVLLNSSGAPGGIRQIGGKIQ
jgi:hypothetical protein